MIVVTSENIPSYRVVELKGTVFGIVCRSRGVGKDITAAFRGLVGGEIKEYTELLEDTRLQAIDRMVKNASLMGANAVVMVRFDSASIGSSMTEVLAYGTAVIAEKIE
ncbi:heavy metal-binding domain-containing protein [Paenibacillus sp. JCM 10914]|uniref:heavy metal-binding domain-containing protein n=1 Tax=Paenibacillus sp. JCM 10914 TaxID=1236974 RepID=UPI0003CCAF18|nr:heavy metal-binding domain-containing protein [Paenibacillus sp. JCM 10914]GAE09526.1 PlcB, ORFX, ORFP, ORFB, ORFA, ldh gene [Paenibacillus sp. JCM 10914]